MLIGAMERPKRTKQNVLDNFCILTGVPIPLIIDEFLQCFSESPRFFEDHNELCASFGFLSADWVPLKFV